MLQFCFFGVLVKLDICLSAEHNLEIVENKKERKTDNSQNDSTKSIYKLL